MYLWLLQGSIAINRNVESNMESGTRRFLGLGSRELKIFALKFSTPGSPEMSHFYVKKIFEFVKFCKNTLRTFFLGIFFVNFYL